MHAAGTVERGGSMKFPSLLSLRALRQSIRAEPVYG